MRTDYRLPRVLHVLLHLEQSDAPITSDKIGKMLATNSSLVRRIMAGLRSAGLVNSTKGHGGGWILEKPLKEISLAQVYQALGSPNLFALGQSTDTHTCLLEQAANQATSIALEAARIKFNAELEKVKVSDLTSTHVTQIHEFNKQKT